MTFDETVARAAPATPHAGKPRLPATNSQTRAILIPGYRLGSLCLADFAPGRT